MDFEKEIMKLKENDIEYRLKILNLFEKLDQQEKKIDKLDEKMDEFIGEIKNGYIPKRVLETIKQENEVVEKVVINIVYKKIGRWVTALIGTNIFTLIVFLIQFFK